MKTSLIIALLVPCFAICLFAKGKKVEVQSSFAGYIRYTEAPANATAIADNAVAPLLSATQKAHVATPHDERIAAFSNKEKRAALKATGCTPQSVVIGGCNGDSQVMHRHTFEIAENSEFKDAVTFTVTSPRILISNLKAGTKYFWRITCKTTENQTKEPSVHCFTTENIAPRLVTIDGVQNVRDCGGWTTNDGKRIRQNMIFRSAGLNSNASAVYKKKEDILAENPNRKDLEEKHLNAIRLATSSMNDNVTFLPVESLLIDKNLMEWTVFRIPKGKCDGTDMENFMKLSNIPTEYCTFLGGKLAAVVKRKTVVIPDGESFETALLIMKVNSNANGMVQVTYASSVPCAIAVNGNVLVNSIGVTAKPSLTLGLPVKTGENIVAVVLTKQGLKEQGAGMTFSFGLSHKAMDYKTMCEKRIKFENDIVKKMFDHILDHWKPGKNKLKQDMQKYLTEGLAVKTDIDLRSEKECQGMPESPLGKGVVWEHIPLGEYDEIDKKDVRTLFKALLNPRAYPLILHGANGQNRTGTAVFLINGILGVPEEQLLMDWEASAFCSASASFRHANKINKLLDALKSYPGKDINERIENYLLSCDITKDEIQTLRNFLKE